MSTLNTIQKIENYWSLLVKTNIYEFIIGRKNIYVLVLACGKSSHLICNLPFLHKFQRMIFFEPYMIVPQNHTFQTIKLWVTTLLSMYINNGCAMIAYSYNAVSGQLCLNDLGIWIILTRNPLDCTKGLYNNDILHLTFSSKEWQRISLKINYARKFPFCICHTQSRYTD